MRPGTVLQQLDVAASGDASVNDTLRPVSRFFDRITRPEQLWSLPEACRVLASPLETGRVVLSLPQDVQSEAFDFPVSFFGNARRRIARPEPSVERIAELAGLLVRAQRPVIISGGGVYYAEAEAELLAFARSSDPRG